MFFKSKKKPEDEQNDEPVFRAMQRSDVKAALKIINGADTDDRSHAAKTYKASLEDKYVLVIGEHLVGVTGLTYAEETERTYWLSWTYIATDFRNLGYGKLMLNRVLEIMQEMEVRKTFISTSDFWDAMEGDIYDDAKRLYQSLSFVEEVRVKDYYASGEDMFVFARRIDPALTSPPMMGPPDNRSIVFDGFHLAPEGREAYIVDWHFGPEGQENTAADQFENNLAKLRNPRCALASVPSDAQAAIQGLKDWGLIEVGRMRDFFEDGVDNVMFRYDLY